MPTPWKRTPEELHATYVANTEAFYRVAGRGLAQELDDFVTSCALGLWKCSRNLNQQHVDAANALYSSTSNSRIFIRMLTNILLYLAAVDDEVTMAEAEYITECSDRLTALCDGANVPRSQAPINPAEYITSQEPSFTAKAGTASSGGAQSETGTAAAEQPEKPDLDELMAELDELVGLETVKKEVKSLMNLSPKKATVLREGIETEVNIEAVKKGDVFVVRPGDSIPVDGVVLEGETAVDESMLTGESVPVDKSAGSAVSAATINRSGFIRCEATRVGEDTTLSQIIKMVSDAAATKAPIAKIADKVSGIFVPTVISIAVVTFIIWLIIGAPIGTATARAISVLVISCPCALGLATPVAIMVGSGVGARSGILFKTAVSLEETGKIKVAALDKTGTITQGKPVVTDIVPYEVREQELLQAAASLEKKSEHPLAQAIIEEAENRKIIISETEHFSAVSGKGLTATLKGETVSGGNLSYISRFCDIPDQINQKAGELANQGKTPLYFSKGNNFLGVIAVADVIKPESCNAHGRQ